MLRLDTIRQGAIAPTLHLDAGIPNLTQVPLSTAAQSLLSQQSLERIMQGPAPQGMSTGKKIAIGAAILAVAGGGYLLAKGQGYVPNRRRRRKIKHHASYMKGYHAGRRSCRR